MALREFGFDPGAADGNFGPKTFQAIMDARIALNLPEGSHVDQTLIRLLPDVSKIYGAYDGDWTIVRIAENPVVCGWTQFRQRLTITNGSISGTGYSGEVFSDGTIEMKRTFIERHKRRQSIFVGRISSENAQGTLNYDFNECRGQFSMTKGEILSVYAEDRFTVDRSHRASIRVIQEYLNRLGCDVGPADGIWGGRTREGLRKFASRYSTKTGTESSNNDLLTILPTVRNELCRENDTNSAN
jgi:peptidoglycan hydrolase-like protein with peptidoglycan-binding domain